jgi:hypothetical protein
MYNRSQSQENAIACDEILQQFIVVDMEEFNTVNRDSSDFSSKISVPSRGTGEQINQMKDATLGAILAES